MNVIIDHSFYSVVSKEALIVKIGFLQVVPSPATYNQTLYNPQKLPGHTGIAFQNTYCSNL